MRQKFSLKFANGHEYSAEGNRKAVNKIFAMAMLREAGPRRLENGQFASWNPDKRDSNAH